MEISAVYGIGSHHSITTTLPMASCSSSLTRPPLSSAAIKPINNTDSITTAAPTTYLHFKQLNRDPNRFSSKYLSVSNETRKAAVADIQQSPDVEHALERYGKSLKVQDLNVVLRHFGTLKRWKELSQV